jgi:hypothetical protein
MSEPKNQHIIPQCYLKQFVDPGTPVNYEPYVWIFERGNKRGKKKAPKNILAETDFYTLEVKSGEKDYRIEKTLSQIESEYTSIFEKKIKDKIPLNNYEHIVLCAFVAAMFQRTLKQKKNIENFYDQVIEHIEAMEKAHGATPKTSLEWRQKKKNAHPLSLIQMTPEITKILMKMNLAFLCTNKRDSFITSDAPCFLFNSRLQWQRFDSPGLGQKHVEVRMPLSPKISICFSWVNNLRGYLKINSDLIHELNRMVFGHSDEYFIANSPKIKRRWFRRFPLDPIFIWIIFVNETKRKINSFYSTKKYQA